LCSLLLVGPAPQTVTSKKKPITGSHKSYHPRPASPADLNRRSNGSARSRTASSSSSGEVRTTASDADRATANTAEHRLSAPGRYNTRKAMNYNETFRLQGSMPGSYAATCVRLPLADSIPSVNLNEIAYPPGSFAFGPAKRPRAAIHVSHPPWYLLSSLFTPSLSFLFVLPYVL